jgi:parvulin-like peptidyl-prolyl isomerase
LAESVSGDFAAAAKAAGAEVGTSAPFDRRAASTGGDLPPAVLQGAFLLTESQSVSDVTQAGDDFYVFRVVNRQPERPLTFEEARPTAELRLKSNEAVRLLREKSAAAITKIREAVKTGTPIADAAIAAGVTPQTFAGVDPTRPELPMEFMSAARVAVMLEPGQISNFLPTAVGGAAVGVLTRGTEAAGPGKDEMTAQLLENKQDLFFAVWLDSQRKAANIEIPRRQGQ